MSKLKKVLLMCTAYVLVAALAIGGTIAYLQDDDSDVNVMTLGNVSIEQIEQERDADGNLVDFTQAKPLYPAVYSNGSLAFDDDGLYVNGEYHQVCDASVKNVLDKIVTVKNTGKTDAYMRTVIALECPEGFDDNLIGLNVNTSAYKVADHCYIEVDGNRYEVYTLTYKNVLEAGVVSEPSLLQVWLNPTATNEDVEVLDGNDNGTYDILVLSQAVQAAGFADAKTALDTAFGKASDKAAEWFGGVAAKNTVLIDEPFTQIMDATEAYTIDGNGKTVVGVATSIDKFTWDGNIPDMSTIFSSADKTGAKATVNDITFTGTMSAVMAGQYINSSSNWFNTEFNNVNIIDAEVVSFSAGIAPALCVYGNMTMNNCVVTGTTMSALDAEGWTAYDVAVVNYSNTVINDSKIGSLYMWNQAKVTVADGTEIDTIVIRGNMNATKYGLIVEAGATVGIIDLTNIANVDRVNITIENGATVGAFVDNGVEYATLDAWKAAQ